jgi:hypothetical protein
MNPIRWPPSCRLSVCVLHRLLSDHMRLIVGLLAVVTLAFSLAAPRPTGLTGRW